MNKGVKALLVLVVAVVIVSAYYLSLSLFFGHETGVVKNSISLQSVHLWANTSSLYIPTLELNLLISSALKSLDISINGIKVHSESFYAYENLTNWQAELGVEIKNPDVVILVGKIYVVGFTGTFSDKSVYSASAMVIAELPYRSYISLLGVSLENETYSVYPPPYLSAEILVNATVPLSKLTLFINGTYEETYIHERAGLELNQTIYVLLYKAGPNNPAMPIIPGRTYEIMFVAIFQDNSTSTASASVVAG
jgi:hypothetical protein